jgi:hypothetical protein
LGRPAADDETLIRTMALNGQLMCFNVMRLSALATLGWDRVDAPRLTLLKRVLREQTSAMLRSLCTSRARSGDRKRGNGGS